MGVTWLWEEEASSITPLRLPPLRPWEPPKVRAGSWAPSSATGLSWEGPAARLPRLTLASFFTASALLSLLEVLAALGELRPLERMSSLVGEARPSGLAGCFFRPLRNVDICPPKPAADETDPSTHGASRADPTVGLRPHPSPSKQAPWLSLMDRVNVE